MKTMIQRHIPFITEPADAYMGVMYHMMCSEEKDYKSTVRHLIVTIYEVFMKAQFRITMTVILDCKPKMKSDKLHGV
jgi:hypothetical protein